MSDVDDEVDETDPPFEPGDRVRLIQNGVKGEVSSTSPRVVEGEFTGQFDVDVELDHYDHVFTYGEESLEAVRQVPAGSDDG